MSTPKKTVEADSHPMLPMISHLAEHILEHDVDEETWTSFHSIILRINESDFHKLDTNADGK